MRYSKNDIFIDDIHELSLRYASLSTTTGSMMKEKHDKNFSMILQLGNVQKNQWIHKRRKDYLFREKNSDLLSTRMDLPTARYTETEIKEVMNYILYDFISSVCMHTCMWST